LTNRYLHGVPEDSRVAKPSVFLKRERITEDYLVKANQLSALVQQVEDSVAAIHNLTFTDGELQAIETILVPSPQARSLILGGNVRASRTYN
jgi:L-glyceraldehyde 3-phosphate reductase